MKYNHTILNQVLNIVPRSQFQKNVDQYQGDHRIRRLSCWSQFVAMAYGQLRQRDTLRSIETGIMSQHNKLYHLGVKTVCRSTLSDANTKRDHRIFEQTFYDLLSTCQQMSNHKLGFKNPIKSIDATLIPLCYALCPWAKYRKRKGAIKLHMLLEHDTYLPEFINITEGHVHEIKIGRQIPIQADSIYAIDRGYYDFEWLYSVHQQGASFVIRAKADLSYQVIGQHEIKDPESNVISDEDIQLPWRRSKYPSKQPKYPEPLRMVTYKDPDTGQILRFLTNNESYSAETIALIYKQRWQIEIFFKWIKQNLKIKSFIGCSQNAVLSQVWIAMIVYLLIWYIKFQTKYKYSLLQLTRILNETAFERVSLIDILQLKRISLPRGPGGLQLSLFYS